MGCIQSVDVHRSTKLALVQQMAHEWVYVVYECIAYCIVRTYYFRNSDI